MVRTVSDYGIATYQIRDGLEIREAVGACGSGKYKGERCLIPGTKDKPGKFPVTKGGKPSPGRIRNVNVRATQFGYPGVIKKNIPFVKKHTKGTSKFLPQNK